MLQNQKVPSVRLEDLPFFGNILISRITNVSMRLDLLPCFEMIGCIMFKADARGMIMYNVEDKGFASFTTTFIAKSYRFLVSEVSMTTCWINRLTIDYVGCTRMAMEEGNSFRQRASGEYETAGLRTSYRLAALMLNRIFDRDMEYFIILVGYH